MIPLWGWMIAVVVIFLASYFIWYFRQPPKKTIDLRDYKSQAFDLVISWSQPGFIAYIVSKIIQLWTGVKNPPTHAMHFHSREKIASAELKGFRILPAQKRLKECRRVVVFRPNLNYKQREKIYTLDKKFQGKDYDIPLYILHLIRIAIVFIPVLFYYTRLLHWKYSLILCGALFLVYFPIQKLLKKWEKARVACSEVVSLILMKSGILKGLGEAMNVAPHHLLWIYLNSRDFKCVFDSEGEYTEK